MVILTQLPSSARTIKKPRFEIRETLYEYDRPLLVLADLDGVQHLASLLDAKDSPKGEREVWLAAALGDKDVDAVTSNRIFFRDAWLIPETLKIICLYDTFAEPGGNSCVVEHAYEFPTLSAPDSWLPDPGVKLRYVPENSGIENDWTGK